MTIPLLTHIIINTVDYDMYSDLSYIHIYIYVYIYIYVPIHICVCVYTYICMFEFNILYIVFTVQRVFLGIYLASSDRKSRPEVDTVQSPSDKYETW